MNTDSKYLEFADRNSFRSWLKNNHEQTVGVWISFEKGDKSFSANDALEEAICFGWIDGVIRKIDELKYLKYFSRRKNNENWSDRNIKIYHSLANAGLMTKAGENVFCHKGNINKKKININECINVLKNSLADKKEVLDLFCKVPLSRQKRFSGFYCDAKNEETRNKRLVKIIDAIKTNYDGMLY